MDDRETVEHVPWADLAAAAAPERRHLVILGGTVLAGIVIGVLVGRTILAPSAPVGAPPDPPAEAPVGTSIPAASTTAAALPTEADLFAVDERDPELAAATRAEWFVTDFFTADLEPSGPSNVRSALPTGAVLPPRADEAAGSVAYVEWAKAFNVERAGADTYRVDVAYRSLGAPPDRGWIRQPVRAVSVLVSVGPEGGTTVTDLPTPLQMPAGPAAVPWPTDEAEAPTAVVAGAVATAAAWGSEPRLLSSQVISGGWRIVMTVADDVGNRWPVTLLLDPSGRPLG